MKHGTSIPCPDYVKSDPQLKSIFDRIRTGQRFKLSDFAHFIAPLVQDLEAAAVGFIYDKACAMKTGRALA